MSTFLLTWNPKNWDWIDLPDQSQQVETAGGIEVRWSCGRSRRLLPGDRVFLLRQGVDPRGVVGSGVVTSEPREAAHWADPTKTALYIDLEFDALLDPARHEILPRTALNQRGLENVHWDTQSSGIEIEPDAAEALEQLWGTHLQRIGYAERTPMPHTPITLNPDGLAAMRAAFLSYCTDFVDFPTRSGIHHTEERLYKEELVQVFHEEITPALFEGLPDVETAHRVVEAARAVLNRRLPSEGKPQNLLGWRVFWFLKKMTDDESVAFAEALRDLLYGTGDSADRLERFDSIVYPTAKRLQKAVSAWTAHSPTFWLMLQSPADDIFIGKTKFIKAFELLVGHSPFTGKLFDAAQYRYIQQVCHALFDALVDWGWKPRDMIDVQGFIWTAMDPVDPPPPNGTHFTRLLQTLTDAHLTFSP